MFVKLSLCLALVSFSACRSTQKQFAAQPKPKSLEPEERTPPELWSPEERSANSNYYFMRAEDAMYRGERKSALRLFEKAYNLDPNSFLAAKLIAAKAYSEPEEAFKLCKKMVLLYPQDLYLNVIYGQLLLLTRSYEAASMQFSRVLRIDDKNLEAYMGLVQAKRSLGDHDGAVEYSKSLLQAEPSFAPGWAILAKLYLSRKQTKEALEAAEQAYEIQQNEAEYQHLYALTLELSGRNAEALALYEQVFRTHPGNDELIQKMVHLYKQIGSLRQALLMLEDAKRELKKDQSSFGIDMQMAVIYWELKDFRATSAVLASILKNYPEKERVIYMAGLSAERQRDYLAAMDYYSRLKESSDFYVEAQFRSAVILKGLKEYQQAEKLILPQLDSDGKPGGDFHLLLAQVYFDQKKYTRAADLLEKASADFTDRVDLKFYLGIVYEKKGDIATSIAVMKDIIKRKADHTGALNFLAYTYAEEGTDLDEAEKLAKRALAIKPGDGYYLDTLGWVYYKQERYPESIKVLEKAVTASPNEAILLEHLAEAQLKAGNIVKAKSLFKKASEANGSDEDRSRAKQKYEELSRNEA